MSNMSSITIFTVFAIFFTLFPFHSAISASDFLAPFLSPAISDFCNELGCGKGKCKMSEKNHLQYECECDPGWKQTVFSNNTYAPKFIPCVIPNCTLNHSCSEATASAESGNSFSNASILEPCHWANCGGGVCTKMSGLTYACECNKGYTNLLSNTAFPCFKECSFGDDCSNLGLTLPNTSTIPVPPPSLADSGTNQAKSLQQKALSNGMIVLAMSMAAFVL